MSVHLHTLELLDPRDHLWLDRLDAGELPVDRKRVEIHEDLDEHHRPGVSIDVAPAPQCARLLLDDVDEALGRVEELLELTVLDAYARVKHDRLARFVASPVGLGSGPRQVSSNENRTCVRYCLGVTTPEEIVDLCSARLTDEETERLTGWIAWRQGRNQALAGDRAPDVRLLHALANWLSDEERDLLLAWMRRRMTRGESLVP